MKVTLDVSLLELEEDDTIQGYKIKDLIIVAEAARRAGIENEDLANFVRNAENAWHFVKEENDRLWLEATRLHRDDDRIP